MAAHALLRRSNGSIGRTAAYTQRLGAGFEGYWKDVGTLDSLWDANMDMLSPGSGLNLLLPRI